MSESKGCAANDRTLVVAGAGTGKTHTMIAKARDTVRTGIARASDIAFVTFTRKAAQDIREHSADREGMEIGTLHHLARLVIARAEGRKPRLSPLAEDDRARLDRFEAWLLEAIQADPSLLADLETHALPRPGKRGAAPGGTRSTGRRARALDGRGEARIATSLHLAGIDYRYEAEFPIPEEHQSRKGARCWTVSRPMGVRRQRRTGERFWGYQRFRLQDSCATTKPLPSWRQLLLPESPIVVDHPAPSETLLIYAERACALRQRQPGRCWPRPAASGSAKCIPSLWRHADRDGRPPRAWNAAGTLRRTQYVMRPPIRCGRRVHSTKLADNRRGAAVVKASKLETNGTRDPRGQRAALFPALRRSQGTQLSHSETRWPTLNTKPAADRHIDHRHAKEQARPFLP